jgi:hypothetical protein
MSAALSNAAFETFAALLKTRSGLMIGTDKIFCWKPASVAWSSAKNSLTSTAWPIGCASRGMRGWRATWSRR